MAKNDAAAKAVDDDAYPDIELYGAVIKGLPKFAPGPDGNPTQEELDAVEAQRLEIEAIVGAKRKAEKDAEDAALAVKKERAERRESAARDLAATVARLVKDVDELKKARA